MSNKRLRQIIRIVHIVVSGFILALVYIEPIRDNTEFVAIIQLLSYPLSY